MSKSRKAYLNYFIRFLIVGLATWFVYDNVTNEKKVASFLELKNAMDDQQIIITVSVVVALMLVNWLLEVRKWQVLTADLEPMSFWKATKSVFCGLTWAIFTPNRIGEYGGRILILQNEHRGKGAVLMGVGLFAQLVLTSFFGAVSIPWFIQRFFNPPLPIMLGIWTLGVIYALAFVLLYFNVQWVDLLVSKIKFLHKIKPFFSVLEGLSSKKLLDVLLLALSRFVVFTSQYVILMLVILPDMAILPMVMMIFILFFVQAVLPTIDIFDFSVRSFVASHLYRYITDQEIAVMAIVSFVWFVNLILPAVIGMFFVINVNYVNESES